MDSVEVSLLTCEPGTETWSQYGHTAVRWHDKQRGGMDVAINYGVFTPDAPYFVLRFILGLTDYQLGVVPFELFCAQYEYEKRAVCEQVLDLDNADKEAIFSALQVNMRPENVVYRYNYFYDNCTTRARDLLVSHLHGQVSYPAARPAGDDSFRRMIHEWNAQTPWTQTGEDILLGVKADGATTKAQQQFLPDHLRSDFARATYRGKPLVRETREVIRVVRDEATPAFSLTPMALALGLLVLSLIVWAVEWRKQRIFWGWDLLLMVPAGCVGLILTMMIFSQHPCVSLNFLILIFNPLPLLMAYRATRRTIRHEADRWWTIWAVMIVFGLFGRVFQYYPPAMVVVALILLCNCAIHPLLEGVQSAWPILREKMDKMMNRYITALLVVLTATGLEAQAYQSALKAARGGDVALEELCRHSAFQGKEAEILSFIRAIKSVEQRDDQEPAHAPWVAQVDSEGPAGRVACGLSVADRDEVTRLSPALTTAIQIRAPSL